jgi:WD40 repeat protein
MKGHQDRVCRVAFHPSGDYVASASFDTTWRLWDVATSKELLLQEGHSKEVYSVEFQDDGALVASGYVHLSRWVFRCGIDVMGLGDLMLLAEYGICGRVGRLWSLMAMFKLYSR